MPERALRIGDPVSMQVDPSMTGTIEVFHGTDDEPRAGVLWITSDDIVMGYSLDQLFRLTEQEYTSRSWQYTASKISKMMAAGKVEHEHGPFVGSPFGPACATCGRLEATL